MHIEIKKGLDIPIKGKPTGLLQEFSITTNSPETPIQSLALDLKPFQDLRLKLLAKVGDNVKIGQPLVEDKNAPGRYFVAPAAGYVREIRRGNKRALIDIIIDVAPHEESETFPLLDAKNASREQIIDSLKHAGLFTAIRTRPFNRLADPHKPPRAIFVKALESAPFSAPVELQLKGMEKDFQTGLDLLARLTPGTVHLVYAAESAYPPFIAAQNVEKHTASGPHPISNQSLHIQRISPITSTDEIVWTISAAEVAAIGHLARTGQYYTDKVVSIAGPGILPGKTGFFKLRKGFPIAPLLAGRIAKGSMRFISGDPLMGHAVKADDFLGFNDGSFTAIPENTKRQFMHFFRLGLDKYSFSRAYLSGHFSTESESYDFTTSQHGEHRAFIDSSLYDKVMPLDIPTMLLVKAIMAEDFDLAVDLGLLEVDSEDFALPTFVCPSKMEMTEIVRLGLEKYAAEVYATA